MRHAFVVILVAAGALAAPCAALAADEPVTLRLVAKDGRFTPTSLEAPANQRIRIEIVNEGTTPIEFESKSLKHEKVLAPGARAVVVVNPLKPGSYAFFDEFHPASSKGVLVVK